MALRQDVELGPHGLDGPVEDGPRVPAFVEIAAHGRAAAMGDEHAPRVELHHLATEAPGGVFLERAESRDRLFVLTHREPEDGLEIDAHALLLDHGADLPHGPLPPQDVEAMPRASSSGVIGSIASMDRVSPNIACTAVIASRSVSCRAPSESPRVFSARNP